MQLTFRKATLLGVTILALLPGCREPAAPDRPLCRPTPSTRAPEPGSGGQYTDGRYIVVYRDGVDATIETARLSAKYGFVPVYVYNAALLGFSADLPAATVAAVVAEPTVKYAQTGGKFCLD